MRLADIESRKREQAERQAEERKEKWAKFDQDSESDEEGKHAELLKWQQRASLDRSPVNHWQ